MSSRFGIDTHDRSPLEDPLMLALRADLDAIDTEMARCPASSPPWAAIQKGMRLTRRRRRRRGLMKVGAGLLAIGGAGSGVLTGVLPYPTFAPVVAVPGSPGQSMLDDGTVRGSLAADATWLAAFRQHVASGPTSYESGNEAWSPPAASKVSVIYAGDLGEYRLALVEGDWHWGPIGDRQQVWYLGRAGEAASGMQRGANSDPSNIAVMVAESGTLPEPTTTAAALVLSATPVEVRLAPPPVIDVAAKVSFASRVVPATEPGVHQESIPRPAGYTLSVSGQSERPLYNSAAGLESGSPGQLPARGGVALPGDSVSALAQQTSSVARQPADLGDFRLLGVGPQLAQRPVLGDGAVRPVVGVLTLPGGAKVLSGGEAATQEVGSRLYTARLLPGSVAIGDLAIAWHVADVSTQSDDGSGNLTSYTEPGWVAAMGPQGTASLRWVHRDGTVGPVEATTNAMAVTSAQDVVKVRFQDADGLDLATTDVLAPLDSFLAEVIAP